MNLVFGDLGGFFRASANCKSSTDEQWKVVDLEVFRQIIFDMGTNILFSKTNPLRMS